MAENQKEYEKTIPKIIVVGPGRVDKASFIRKVIKNFSENELDLKKNEYLFKHNGKEIKIPVYDLPASNAFPIYKNLVNFNSSVVISVYAIDKVESLYETIVYSKYIKEKKPKNCKYILLGIKNFKYNEIILETKHGKLAQNEFKFDEFFEISDENYDKYNSVFEKAAELLLNEKKGDWFCGCLIN